MLFRRHAPHIRRYVVRRLGQDAADDIVAETFLLAFRQRDSYDQARADARPWLYGIATNLIGRHRRAEIRLYRALARTGADPVMEPFTDRVDDRVSASTASRRLAAGLARLPEELRDTLLLVAWSDLSYQEAATALGIPVGTVRSRISRARSKTTPGPRRHEPGNFGRGVPSMNEMDELSRLRAEVPDRGTARAEEIFCADEQAGLFPCGEVTAAGGLVPVHDIGKAALGPAAGGPGYFFGEDAAPGRDGDDVAGGSGEPLGDLGDAFPVQPGRGRPGSGQPVQGDVVKYLVGGQDLPEVAGMIGPGPQLLHDPGAQPDR